MIYKIKKSSGVSLVEIMVATVVSAIFIAGASALIGTSLKSSQASKEKTVAYSLLSETQEAIKNVVASNWHNIYDLSKSEPNHYKIVKSGDVWTIQSGEETITSNNIVFTRYFVAENISRTNDTIDSTYSSSNDDPSTQKITAYIKWGAGLKVLNLPKYITRSQSPRTFIQSDWSGGSGETNVLLQPNTRYSSDTNMQNITN